MSSQLAIDLMKDFARSTGLTGLAPPRRYLWTDAFAVCNFLGFYRETNDPSFLELARDLVDQVHHVLGRHREDSPRRGWISGLSEHEGSLHPTCCGLRIGKSLDERRSDQPLDQQLEWNRDGQYFHYLTKWMHALHLMGLETGEVRYQNWAVELAVIAQRAFTREPYPGSPMRMVWKMSIDLSRPLIHSMGQHDPLNGLITCLELQTDQEVDRQHDIELKHCIDELSEMCIRGSWITQDPLGIGGLMDDASRLAKMVFNHGVNRRGLLRRILLDAEKSMTSLCGSSFLCDPLEQRLAFRELGLSIGIHGLEMIQGEVMQDEALSAILNRLLEHDSLVVQIQDFWSSPAVRQSKSWVAHRDINTVMLATSLAPASYLRI